MKNVPTAKVSLHPKKGNVKSPMEISNIHGKQDPMKTADHPVKHQPAGTSPAKKC